MNLKPQLELLEDRIVPSVADVAAFQAAIPSLQAQFDTLVPVVQQGLQHDVNQLVAIDRTLPQPQQQQFAPFLTEAQEIVNAFPQLAQAWFVQQVNNQEAALLQVVDGGMTQSTLGGGQTYSSSYSRQGYPNQPPIVSPATSPTSPTYTSPYTSSNSSLAIATANQPMGLYTTSGSLTLL